MNHIKLMLYIPGLLLFLVGCQSKTYYQAMNTNQQRFGGENLKDAEFLNESHDQLRLIEVMAATAMERSQMKDTYFKAKETYKVTDHLTKKYRLEALKRRIKLASALSATSDAYIQKLHEVSDDHFEMLYLHQMQEQLAELIVYLRQYVESGKNERLVAFSTNTFTELEKIAAELNIYSLQLNTTN